tara:strand:- start:211 stop:444 length:234 start_codon:yes stop_codon:yes gene_type:complete
MGIKVMNQDGLKELHNVIAEELMARIKSGEATSGDLSVARQFLRDNGIDASTGQSEPLMNLSKVLPFDPSEPVEDVG